MKKSTFLIAGKHAVSEALKNPKRIVERVFLTEESKKSLNRENQEYNLFKNVKIYYKTKKELDRYCSKDQITHQGLIAEIHPLDQISLKEYISENLNKKKFTFVVLEDVTDPRNIGSIIRSAVAFGVDGLIVKERSFPDTSKLLYKSASGCVENLNIFPVSNINTSLRFLKSKNFWIYGFDKSGEKDFTKIEWKENSVLLFGSEGFGLKRQTLKNSDFLLKVNIDNKVESLNIANTASIVFHYINFNKKHLNKI
ncbi:MAG: 23S rRNA (guanosine(2251)-2'-O)-methyltransferase RlmB [Candidatus Pelagibacter sp. TMED64]|nr:23S rRNA (guanosine(2251)-2'-O)-methyltransferase RlmB [Candidatus Pelagibacter sp.]OUU67062.1 MAG: 23S rRNA (guanosine(2251)-2'-O)-methyltransferase RlmB [Candidatus Pelagibacter sp. TMED64]|tara:strand:+ start:178 stop:939 length:762 start_codon:yes stop_codon:yes gene_type:complete